MPRRRTASNVLTLRGAGKKDPQRMRARDREPVPTRPLGKAPAAFTDAEHAAWAYLAARAPDRVLFFRDEVVLALAARLWASIASRPMHLVRPAEMARMESLLSRMGMTPSDASRVAAFQPAEENEFDGLTHGPRGC